jgi:hypothetical protein
LPFGVIEVMTASITGHMSTSESSENFEFLLMDETGV